MIRLQSFKSLGVGCAILSGNSGVPKSTLASVEDILMGAYSLFFSAPEAIVCGDRWRDMLSEEPLHSRIVAKHTVCISGAQTSVQRMPEFMSSGH